MNRRQDPGHKKPHESVSDLVTISVGEIIGVADRLRDELSDLTQRAEGEFHQVLNEGSPKEEIDLEPHKVVIKLMHRGNRYRIEIIKGNGTNTPPQGIPIPATSSPYVPKSPYKP